MKFLPTKLAGVWLVQLEPVADERGFFARTYCEKTFADQGLNTRWPQCSLTHSLRRGILRGLHYQAEPRPEIKLIRCSAGAIFDVVVDLRAGSATIHQWEAFELTAKNGLQLYVPAGFAHGFQCLKDASEVSYQISEFYRADLARGIRWNDPTLQIPWPVKNPTLSSRDRNLPLIESRT